MTTLYATKAFYEHHGVVGSPPCWAELIENYRNGYYCSFVYFPFHSGSYSFQDVYTPLGRPEAFYRRFRESWMKVIELWCSLLPDSLEISTEEVSLHEGKVRIDITLPEDLGELQAVLFALHDIRRISEWPSWARQVCLLIERGASVEAALAATYGVFAWNGEYGEQEYSCNDIPVRTVTGFGETDQRLPYPNIPDLYYELLTKPGIIKEISKHARHAVEELKEDEFDEDLMDEDDVEDWVPMRPSFVIDILESIAETDRAALHAFRGAGNNADGVWKAIEALETKSEEVVCDDA